jgi:hypothetical protein
VGGLLGMVLTVDCVVQLLGDLGSPGIDPHVDLLLGLTAALSTVSAIQLAQASKSDVPTTILGRCVVWPLAATVAAELSEVARDFSTGGDLSGLASLGMAFDSALCLVTAVAACLYVALAAPRSAGRRPHWRNRLGGAAGAAGRPRSSSTDVGDVSPVAASRILMSRPVLSGPKIRSTVVSGRIRTSPPCAGPRCATPGHVADSLEGTPAARPRHGASVAPTRGCGLRTQLLGLGVCGYCQ